MTALTKYSTRSLASSPSIGSPTNVWISRHSVIAARPSGQGDEQELAERLLGHLLEGAGLVDLLAADLTPGELDGQEAEHQVEHPAGGDAGPGQRIAPRPCQLPSARRQCRGHASPGTRCRPVVNRPCTREPECTPARRWGMIGACQPLTVIVDDDPADACRRGRSPATSPTPSSAGAAPRSPSPAARPAPPLLAALAAARPAMGRHRRLAGRRARRARRRRRTATPTSSPASPASVHLMPVTAPNLDARRADVRRRAARPLRRRPPRDGRRTATPRRGRPATR